VEMAVDKRGIEIRAWGIGIWYWTEEFKEN